MDFLRWLAAFKLCRKLQQLFRSLSLPMVSLMCWGRNIKRRDADRLIERVSSAVRLELESVVVVAERIALGKLLATSDDVCHLLHTTIAAQKSFFGSRLLSTNCSIDRLPKPFPPCTITNRNIIELITCDQVTWCLMSIIFLFFFMSISINKKCDVNFSSYCVSLYLW